MNRLAPPRGRPFARLRGRALLPFVTVLISASVAPACVSERPLPSEPVSVPVPAPIVTARRPSNPPWTKEPALDSVPAGPVRGVFEKRPFKLDALRLERNGLGQVVLIGGTSDEDVRVTLPVMFAPEENLCVRRKMGSTMDGRIVVFRGDERLYSNVYAYVLHIDRVSLTTPYDRGRPIETAMDGQRLGTVSGRLLVMFSDGREDTGPGWMGGHFEDIPVMQKGDVGTDEDCSKGPVRGGLGTARAFRADLAPRVATVKPGPVSGTIGKQRFDARGVVLLPRLASDRARPGWSLLFSSTSLGPNSLPKRAETVPGSGFRTNSNVTVELDSEPRAGTCIERTADFAFSGPIPEMDPFHVQLSITAYVPPKPDAPGRVSGAVVLDWMEGSTILGTFTDAPVLHPDSEATGKGERPIAPERCAEQ